MVVLTPAYAGSSLFSGLRAAELFGSPCSYNLDSCPPPKALKSLSGSPPVDAFRTSTVTVSASACCPPRPGTGVRAGTRTGALSLTAVVTKGKQRRRRRRGGGGDGDGPGGNDGPDGEWPEDFFLSGGGWDGWDGNSGGGGDGSGGAGGSRRWHHGGGGGRFEHSSAADALWLWQLLCLVSLGQALHFVLSPQRFSGGADGGAAGAVAPPVIAVTC